MKNQEFKDKIKTKRVISSENADEISNLLSTDIILNNKKYKIAGKAGTALKTNPANSWYIQDRIYNSYVGFYPIEKPKILIYVVIDTPKKPKKENLLSANVVFKGIMSKAISY